LSACAKPLRDSYRAQHRTDHVLLPPPGVGTGVGTAIDQRLRLAFTAAAPVDDASLIGIELTGRIGGRGAGLRMRSVGNELAARLTETVRRLDLDNRDLPVDRGQDEEEHLARMLIAAAWYQVLARTPIGFAFTPLAMAALVDPGAFTRLLELPHRGPGGRRHRPAPQGRPRPPGGPARPHPAAVTVRFCAQRLQAGTRLRSGTDLDVRHSCDREYVDMSGPRQRLSGHLVRLEEVQ
jgi:hypothetical protein